MNPGEIDAILSGRRKDWKAKVLRCALSIAESPYSWIVNYRNRRFDIHQELIRKVNAPVVSIGNLTTGGTGKTPLVRWICSRLIELGHRPAIVSRGYGAQAGLNDEARELKAELPSVPQIQNRIRYQGAVQALTQPGIDCIVLDDGFQHRQLARDLDVVLLDALCPFGHQHLLPRGTLRESTTGLARAHVVGLSRADLIQTSERQSIRDRVGRIAPNAIWIELRHAPAYWMSIDGQRDSLSSNSKRVAAFCGIGNPAAFRQTLAQIGCEIVAAREFPDHHAYSMRDFSDLQNWASQLQQLDSIVCTMKDLVKLRELPIEELTASWTAPLVPVQALGIEIEILEGETALVARLSSMFSDPAIG